VLVIWQQLPLLRHLRHTQTYGSFGLTLFNYTLST
jgi:hypothetical protein